jgi:hypothetical protein
MNSTSDATQKRPEAVCRHGRPSFVFMGLLVLGSVGMMAYSFVTGKYGHIGLFAVIGLFCLAGMYRMRVLTIELYEDRVTVDGLFWTKTAEIGRITTVDLSHPTDVSIFTDDYLGAFYPKVSVLKVMPGWKTFARRLVAKLPSDAEVHDLGGILDEAEELSE